MTVLVTGGAGYIGSHACLALLEQGYDVVVVDNLVNSSQEGLRRVEELTGKSVPFYQVDVADEPALLRVFGSHSIDAVIHFAGLKAVGESVAKPLYYYATNLGSTLTLLQVMQKCDVNTLVFSSSATVYGDPASVPVSEDAPLQALNPYGRTKLMIEDMLRDIAASDAGSTMILLRYFNPVGAHPSGRIGEDPRGVPNNLFPYISQVAVGRRAQLAVFGNDYPTPDGTCLRDYIHVMDLAEGHVAALRFAEHFHGVRAFNLGTGHPYSVLESIAAFELATGKSIPFHIAPRRPGDSPATYADVARAADILGFHAQRTLAEMCADGWRWQQQNPQGYEG
jgi:UDP-glucose 4-epimerase